MSIRYSQKKAVALWVDLARADHISFIQKRCCAQHDPQPQTFHFQELENENWYHGALPLEDVVCLITERGDFLLRALESDGTRGPMVGFSYPLIEQSTPSFD